MYVFGSGRRRRRGGDWMRGLGLGFANHVGTGGVLDVCMCLGYSGVCREWLGGLDQCLEMWCYVYVSLNYLCISQVQVSVYCAKMIPAHLRCIQCSFLLHLIDICFPPYICLWQTSQIQTSPDFMRSSACHPAGPH